MGWVIMTYLNINEFRNEDETFFYDNFELMFRKLLVIVIVSNVGVAYAQPCNLIIKGDYSQRDSIRISEAFSIARAAVGEMQQAMNEIWAAEPENGEAKNHVRRERWKKEESFTYWLGQPEKIGLVNRKIKKIARKFEKKITLNVTRQNKGRCSGWISAWAIPFGKIRITLCEDFFIYRTHLQEKTLIHEIGHETGMFSHHKIHGCRAARRAANSSNNIAKKSTENYAWLAMSYTGLKCRN